MSFWGWFFKGSGAGPGLRRLFDIWLIFHIAVGCIVASISPSQLCEAAKGLLPPLAGIFIGLSFAWGGNAQALLETQEIKKMAQLHKGGFEEYIYTYQLSILIILFTLVAWGVAGLNIYDTVWPTQSNTPVYFIVGSSLYTLASLSRRECWHVVLGAHAMLLARHNILKNKQKQ